MNLLQPPEWWTYKTPLKRFRRVPQPRKLSRAERRRARARQQSGPCTCLVGMDSFGAYADSEGCEIHAGH